MNCDECGENVPDNLRLCPDCAIPKHSKASRSLASANGYASCPVEQIFREVALMTPAPPKDEDPYQSEEYQKFVESMAQYCHCEPVSNRPCDGVLAGGLCDGMDWRRDYDYEDA